MRINPIVWALLACLVFWIVVGVAIARADDIPVKWELVDSDIIADCIYHAEGGAKTNHPYGILAKYKHTTPRQACINTIDHAKRDFKGGDFIEFLGARYAPIGARNDPKGLNRNWVKNVKRLLYSRLKSERII